MGKNKEVTLKLNLINIDTKHLSVRSINKSALFLEKKHKSVKNYPKTSFKVVHVESKNKPLKQGTSGNDI